MLLYVNTQSDNPQCRSQVLLHCRRLGCTLTCPLHTRQWSDLLVGTCDHFFWIPARFLTAAKPKGKVGTDRKKALKLFLRSLGLIE